MHIVTLDNIYGLCEQYNSPVTVYLEDKDGYQQVISGEDGRYIGPDEQSDYTVFGIQSMPYGELRILVRKNNASERNNKTMSVALKNYMKNLLGIKGDPILGYISVSLVIENEGKTYIDTETFRSKQDTTLSRLFDELNDNVSDLVDAVKPEEVCECSITIVNTLGDRYTVTYDRDPVAGEMILRSDS